jgi:N-acetylglutamate synthase-like GNAT family acetyltransferase
MTAQPTMIECTRDGFTISTDKARLDVPAIHDFLANSSYWARNVPLSTVQKSIENSLCFGIYDDGNRQVGFARVITDYAVFAYLADVFILEDYRGRGLAKWLMACIVSTPELQNLRRWMLATKDAHGLYAQYGFNPLSKPERFMEASQPAAQGSR